MNYRKLNIYLGWLVFLIATTVYFLTIEDTVSLWDCGEYITAAYKLEVGHPPGAPLFMVIGRLFSFFAHPTDAAVWINRLSAICSSATILFMFWSINLLVKKMVLKTKSEMSNADKIAVLGSGFIGALAYTFSDTFWFSAVEGEVYAMASLFTAVVFWAILKWDEEMAYVQGGKLTEEYSPNRWLLLIMFLIGLAIGVHLLGILLVPAIGYVIYFRLWKDVTPGKFILTGLLSVIILGFIQEGVIPGSISMASSFEVAFTNSLGLPFFSGTIFFFLLLVIGLVLGIRYARKKGHTIMYNSLMGLILLLIGYGSFAVIVIRSNANTPLDENDPENLVTLHSYLKREQYGSTPIAFGPYWNSKESGGQFDQNGRWNARADQSNWDSRSAFYLRRYVVKKGEEVIKAFKTEPEAMKYAQANGAEYEETYFESNADFRENVVPTYEQTTFFPRMYFADEPAKVDGYKYWSRYDPSEEGELGKDNLRLPTMGENLRYFFRYQCNWMYMRYFMWNFAGRQNDYQGNGDAMRGNWISGISAIDNARLGNQEEAPYFTTSNPANNKFFFFPLILGLIGLFFHIYKAPKDAFVVFLGFLFTGLAIVIYLNQKTYEPRERDYAYAGSFYFFAMWIGVAVYALYYAFTTFTRKHFIKTGVVFGGGLLLFAAVDIGSDVSMPNALSWIFIGGVAIALLGIMTLLRKVLKNELHGAIVAILIGIVAPLIMANQGWDDHDRSNKTTAHDLAANYLDSCTKNGILFTNGDNDTFPLWYMQEVEEYRTDVRVCNLSLMQTDWYTEQMKMKAYDSDPLPIKFREDQVLMYAGNTDQLQFVDMDAMFSIEGMPQALVKKALDMHLKGNIPAALAAINNFSNGMTSVVAGITVAQPNAQARVEKLKLNLTSLPTDTAAVADNIYAKYSAIFELFSAYRNGAVTMDESILQGFQTNLEVLGKGWEAIDIADAMEFARDDENLVTLPNMGTMRFVPSSTFRLKVNVDNAIKSKQIKESDRSKAKKEIIFTFKESGITREEIMMMDILANNDWKRGIYFSSPGGSALSRALFYGGAIKQNGMAFELNPLKEVSQVAADEMYENLMKNYKYGEMANPDVLTDYYARRHTAQYRLHFATLAEYYTNKVMQAQSYKTQGPGYLDYLKSMGKTDEAEEVQYVLANFDKVVAESKKRASALLRRSLEIMPAAVVLDNGEPTSGRESMKVASGEYPTYQDGTLVDYIEMLYISGDKKTAESLGFELAKQYESEINYFLVSHPSIILNSRNHKDIFATMSNYFKIVIASNDASGNPSGKLAAHTKTYIMKLYQVKFKELYSTIESDIEESGESARRGSTNFLTMQYFQLRDYLDAMGEYYGIIAGQAPPAAVGGQQSMDINQMLEQQMRQDSVNQ